MSTLGIEPVEKTVTGPVAAIVSVESGVGWMLFLFAALDYELEEAAPESESLLSMKPSDYFRRQIYACFWFERRGFRAALDALVFTTSCSRRISPTQPACIQMPGARGADTGGPDLRRQAQIARRHCLKGVFDSSLNQPIVELPSLMIRMRQVGCFFG